VSARYGFADADIHARLLEAGFRLTGYQPFARRLVALEHRWGCLLFESWRREMKL
jgi:hypothetical protein